MKKYLLLFSVLFYMCQNKNTSAQSPSEPIQYPEAFQKILTAHGGLDKWQSFRTLSYKIGEEDHAEHQVIDLYDRRERIDGKNFAMGYDGEGIWIAADSTYKGNPSFYKNLMFYFYTMPFVLADPGINYNATEPLSYDGQEYPGYRISYNPEIGISPEDEYFIHYNPETYQMEWLGYTVTYFTNKKSDKIKWIRYDDWKDIEGLLLPSSINWYENENNLPLSPKNKRIFTQVNLSKQEAIGGTYDIIPDAKYVNE